MVKGFTCGTFDLLHVGHMLMFKEIRNQCDFLVVGLQTNPTLDRPEKNKPIETIEERKIKLEGCKYIDQIILYNTEIDLYNLLKELKPNVRFVGADWKDRHFTGDDLPIKVIFNSRNHDYSSSNLKKRIFESFN
ncbi:MAG: adenylyltransferase/cytidyltransferase family protein [Candidatus Paceibacterota bacterium]|jgi:glycerol-3-phosphate cytidylyltransferase